MTAHDRLLIRGLAARAHIGITADERAKRQDLLIDLAIWTDHRAAIASGSFEDALDYRALKKDVLAYVEASSHELLEALAGHVAALCLKNDRVTRIRVTIDKPGALRFARSVAAEVDRTRRDAV